MYKVVGSVLVGFTGYAVIKARSRFPVEFVLEDTQDQVHRFWVDRGIFHDRLEVCTQSRVNECLERKLLVNMDTRYCKFYNSFRPIKVNLIHHKDHQALNDTLEQAYNKILADRQPPFFKPTDPDRDLIRWEKPDPKKVAAVLQKVIDDHK